MVYTPGRRDNNAFSTSISVPICAQIALRSIEKIRGPDFQLGFIREGLVECPGYSPGGQQRE